MTSEKRYRIIGDIRVKGKTPPNGRKRERKVEISYINQRTTDLDSIAIIQPRRLLTPDAPYFFLEVKECGKIIILLDHHFVFLSRSKRDYFHWNCTD